jgi:copper homeostasis protein
MAAITHFDPNTFLDSTHATLVTAGLWNLFTMPTRLVLEICVESLDRAVTAEQGGADRVELCSDLYSGGVTPSAEAMQAARRHVRIPIHALIRPRAGDFLYSDSEFETMKRDIRIAKELGMDGIVLGILNQNDQVDRRRTSFLVKLAHPLPVTFHRAFDVCRNLSESLDAVIETGATRLLTAGGTTRVTNGITTLAELIENAGERIAIMPGGGIRASNLERILSQTGAKEIHTSLSSPRKHANHHSEVKQEAHTSRDRNDVAFETRVRKFRQLVDTFSVRR